MFLFGPPNVEKMKARHNVKRQIEALGYKKDAAIRQQAAKALRNIGDPPVVEPLIAALMGEDRNVQQVSHYNNQKIKEAWLTIQWWRKL